LSFVCLVGKKWRCNFANRHHLTHPRKKVESRRGLFVVEPTLFSHSESPPALAKLPMAIASTCLDAVAMFALPDGSPIFSTSSYAPELARVEFNGSTAFRADAVHNGRSDICI